MFQIKRIAPSIAHLMAKIDTHESTFQILNFTEILSKIVRGQMHFSY